MTVQPLWEARRGRVADRLVQYTAITTLIAVMIVFSAAIPTLATPQNLKSVLVNNFALLAIVSIGMTLTVAAGESTSRSGPPSISQAWRLYFSCSADTRSGFRRWPALERGLQSDCSMRF